MIERNFRSPLLGIQRNLRQAGEVGPTDVRPSVPTDTRQRDPLDDLMTIDELGDESSKATTSPSALKDDARRKTRRAIRGRVTGLVVLLMLLVGLAIESRIRSMWGRQSNKRTTNVVTLETNQDSLIEKLSMLDVPPVAADARESKNAVKTDGPFPEPVTSPTQLKRISEIQPFYEYAEPSIPLTPEELYAKMSPSVVRVNVLNSQGKPIGHGSGFFVRDRSTVVTNFHVIENADSAEVVLNDGTRIPVQGIHGFDEDADIAVLQVGHYQQKNVVAADGPEHTIKGPSPLHIGPNQLPRIGSVVYVIGAPRGLDGTFSDGKVSGHREKAGRPWIQISAPISPGSSGSPVLSADGLVVGVATESERVGQNLNFASPTSAIALLLADQRPLRKLSELIDVKKRKLAAIRAAAEKPMPEDAEAMLAQLPPSFQTLPDYWVLKGELAESREEWAAAIGFFRKAITIDDGDSMVWYRIGRAHQIVGTMHEMPGQYEDAIHAFRAGTKANPKDEDCWRGLGKALQSTKRLAEALVAFRRALVINPNRSLTHTEMGDVLAERGDVDGGLAEYKTALSMEQNRDVVQFNYGRFLQRQGRCREAIGEFEKSLELTKDPILKGWIKVELQKSRSRLTLPNAR